MQAAIATRNHRASELAPRRDYEDRARYDTVNRLRESLLGTGNTTYHYDADGRRVNKEAPGGDTVYVYDLGGSLVAEYSTEASGVAGTRYLTTDALGSTRLVTKSDRSIAGCYDYHLFGVQIAASLGDPPDCYSLDEGIAQKFTGKERDEETGLDYFGARYMWAVQGRFTSPDPLIIHPGRLANPQRLNLYMYARNNPLLYIDPNGLDDITYDQSGQEIDRVKKSKRHNFWHGDTHKLNADDGTTYTLDAALKPLEDGRRYSLISASDTASLISGFASSHSGDSGVQGTPADVMANSREDQPWDLKNSPYFVQRGYSARTSLFLLGDGGAYRADYVGNMAWGMIMASHGWGEMAAHAGAGSQSFFANLMRGGIYSPTTFFDDPRDYEAIRRGYGMYGASGRAPFHWLTNSIYQVARKDPTGCALVGACR